MQNSRPVVPFPRVEFGQGSSGCSSCCSSCDREKQSQLQVFTCPRGVCKYYISMLGGGGGSEGITYFDYVVRGGGGSRGKRLILLI